MAAGKVNIKDDLAARFEAVKAERGAAVPLDDIKDVVDGILASLGGDVSAVDVVVHNELQSLVKYINNAKQEIASIRPQEIREHDIKTATDELAAVVAATEEATSNILEAAELLENLSIELGGDAAARITDITTKIYEASGFQDLTGQRITKVVKTLRSIEDKVTLLARAVGIEMGSGEIKIKEVTGEEALLNGPALPTKANSQEDIDALFASF